MTFGSMMFTSTQSSFGNALELTVCVSSPTVGESRHGLPSDVEAVRTISATTSPATASPSEESGHEPADEDTERTIAPTSSGSVADNDINDSNGATKVMSDFENDCSNDDMTVETAKNDDDCDIRAVETPMADFNHDCNNDAMVASLSVQPLQPKEEETVISPSRRSSISSVSETLSRVTTLHSTSSNPAGGFVYDYRMDEFLGTEFRYVERMEECLQVVTGLRSIRGFDGSKVVGNLAAVIACHRAYLAEVEAASGDLSAGCVVSGRFASRVEAMREVYEVYAADVEVRRERVRKVARRGERVRRLLRMGRHDLEGVILEPIQRIGKYPLLFKDLMGLMQKPGMWNDDEGAAAAEGAVETAKGLARAINDVADG
ncbi:hypothetical protein HK097_003280, partial [Rhizophlyctis rosea]